MQTDIISYSEAATLLGLPIGTVYSLVSQKRIPHIRLGNRLVRFSVSEIQNWLHSHRVESGETQETKLQRKTKKPT